MHNLIKKQHFDTTFKTKYWDNEKADQFINNLNLESLSNITRKLHFIAGKNVVTQENANDIVSDILFNE